VPQTHYLLNLTRQAQKKNHFVDAFVYGLLKQDSGGFWLNIDWRGNTDTTSITEQEKIHLKESKMSTT
jgi:hypothetical protein